MATTLSTLPMTKTHTTNAEEKYAMIVTTTKCQKRLCGRRVSS